MIILLATSCSKDEVGEPGVEETPAILSNETTNVNNDQKEAETEMDENVELVPFTVQVGKNTTLSKVSYTNAESGGKWFVMQDFDANDVNLEMKISGTGVSGSLYLTDWESGIFSGTLRVGDGVTAETELTGTVIVNPSSTVTSSKTSITDLMNQCRHEYTTVGLKYGTTETVFLKDKVAYLEIIMSDRQHIVTVNGTDYEMGFFSAVPLQGIRSSCKVWIAIMERTAVSTNFIYRSGIWVDGGHIYTINREGFVDLGIPNVLWADCNLGAEFFYEPGDYKNMTNVMVTVASNPKVELPEYADFETLLDKCYWEKGTQGTREGCFVYKSKSVDDHGATKGSSFTYNKATDPNIFLPACGYYLGDNVNTGGCFYWTKTPKTDGLAVFYTGSGAFYMSSFGDDAYKYVARLLMRCSTEDPEIIIP